MELHEHKKAVTRFTFDCPTELHSIAKMKASASKQSLKEYLIGLLVKDISENPPKFMDTEAFQAELRKIFKADAELMRELTDR